MTIERVERRLARLAYHFPMLSWEEGHYKRAWVLVQEVQYGVYKPLQTLKRALGADSDKGDYMAFDTTAKAVNAAKKQPRGVIKKVLDGVEAKKKEKGNGKAAVARGPQNPSREVQPTLPGTEEGLPKIPASIKRLLPEHLETILERSRLSKKEADERKTIGDLMIKHEVKRVPLDNGAFLVLEHIEDDKVKYVPAKEKKTKAAAEGEDAED